MSHIGSPPCDAGQILHGARAPRCQAATQRWTLVTAILGSSMAFVDGTVVNVALPALQRALGASAAEIGPVIGGYLIDHHSWTWAFLINVPVGLVLLLVCRPRVAESRGASAENRLDVAGAVLATAGLAGVVFALIEAPARGWSAPV